MENTPESFRIAAASLGLDRNGLAEIFGISDRSAQRWISEWMPPQRVQDQMIAWQRALSALIEHDLDDIDRNAAPGTIRGDLGIEFTENLIHGSDGPESAVRELGLFFPGL